MADGDSTNYRGGGGPVVGVSVESGVLGAVGKIGTPGVIEGAGRTLSAGEINGAVGAARRIRNSTLTLCPAPTVTLSSATPRPGCQARIRYLPTGTPSMLNAPLAGVCAKYG